MSGRTDLFEVIAFLVACHLCRRYEEYRAQQEAVDREFWEIVGAG